MSRHHVLITGLKGLTEEMNGARWKLEPFPPGTFEEYILLENGSVKLERQVRYHSPGDIPHFNTCIPPDSLVGENEQAVLDNVRKLFTEAVRKRLMADRRIGCLLSGGLDSSLVAALLVRLAKEAGLPYRIQTFSIGMQVGDSNRLVSFLFVNLRC